jgi:hypothetical protein
MGTNKEQTVARSPAAGYSETMCNLYSVTSTQMAIRELARAMRDIAGS